MQAQHHSEPATPATPDAAASASSPAQAVADLSARLQAARAAGHCVRVRGGGTKDFYGNALQGEVLSTAALDHVVAYEPTELVITVGAGMRLDALNALLAANQQCLPCDPPQFGAGSTIGGVVASALAGPARASVGGVKDFVLGIEMLDGTGQALRFGGQVMKNVAGYDMSRLMVGSMGTLGVLTEISVKVLPIATAQATLQLRCSQTQALTLINQWGGEPLPLNASTWLVEDGADTFYLRLRGAKAAVDAACQYIPAQARAAQVACEVLAGGGCGAASGGGSDVEAVRIEALWASWRDQTHAFFQAPSPELCLWRVSVAQTAPALDLPYATLVEWHGAQRWLWAPANQAQAIRAAAVQAGGHATLFRASPAHGEADKQVGVFQAPQQAVADVGQRLSEQLDPHRVFATARM
jgi:glycolate oxidase FAD binding subunit